MRVNVFLDSGAPTLYNKLARKVGVGMSAVMGSYLKARRRDNFAFLEDPDYLQYRDKYVEYIQENAEALDVYANLDVINNPVATWENQKYLEDRGLNPIPVFHFGSSPRWLKRYIDKGYEYVALGGMVPNKPTVLFPGLDELWDKYLTDGKGMPLAKVHGFAATSVPLMVRYPWYSVDSATWIKQGIYGKILVPKLFESQFLYTVSPRIVFVSTRTKRLKRKDVHINNMSPTKRQVIEEHVESKGFKLGKSEFRIVDKDYVLKEDELEVEKVEAKMASYHIDEKYEEGQRLIEHLVVPGLCNMRIQRIVYNAIFYSDVNKHIPEWPWAFKRRVQAGRLEL